MGKANKKIYLLLLITWLFLISSFTVFKYAPEWLNSDVLINSVMSLQKVTLFYWGQNRLLNILPAITSLIKNPAINLGAVLFIASLSFYLFLFIISRLATMVANPSNSSYFLSLKVFVAISTVFITIFSSQAIFEIVIWHIEYSFSALLLSLYVSLIIVNRRRNNVWHYVVSIIAIVLATGVNPSVLIAAVFIAIAVMIYRKQLALPELVLIVSSLISFLLWDFIAKQYGHLSYNQFDITSLPIGLLSVFNGFIKATNLPALFIVIVFFIFIKTLLLRKKKTLKHSVLGIENYTKLSVIVFCIIWLVVFSSSYWIEVNLFAWRYFTFVIFGLFIVLAVEFAQMFDQMKLKFSVMLTSSLMLITLLTITSIPISFHNYSIFIKINHLSKPGSHLYTGDYWLVWPSVFRDLMYGHEAYGLTFRGESNSQKAKGFIFSQIINDGYLSVVCLNQGSESCIDQIDTVVGPIEVSRIEYINDQVYKIIITEYDQN